MKNTIDILANAKIKNPALGKLFQADTGNAILTAKLRSTNRKYNIYYSSSSEEYFIEFHTQTTNNSHIFNSLIHCGSFADMLVCMEEELISDNSIIPKISGFDKPCWMQLKPDFVSKEIRQYFIEAIASHVEINTAMAISTDNISFSDIWLKQGNAA